MPPLISKEIPKSAKTQQEESTSSKFRSNVMTMPKEFYRALPALDCLLLPFSQSNRSVLAANGLVVESQCLASKLL